ncbi:MAG: hypothetical protein RLZZ519_2201 [Bacteroidota bacterium]|jgi:hypothetical protein
MEILSAGEGHWLKVARQSYTHGRWIRKWKVMFGAGGKCSGSLWQDAAASAPQKKQFANPVLQPDWQIGLARNCRVGYLRPLGPLWTTTALVPPRGPLTTVT